MPKTRSAPSGRATRVVGRALRDLDGPEVGVRNPEVLSLAAGNLPVELGVAEQGRSLPLLPDLSGLALRIQLHVAHEAVAAGDVEGDDDAVARLQVLHARTDLFDDAHRLVAEDVAGVDEHPEHPVQVEVRATDGGRRDPEDGVGRLLDLRVGDGIDADVFHAVPCQRLHARASSC